MIVVSWPLTFLRQGQICSPCICMGKMFMNHFLKMYSWLMAETYNWWLKLLNFLVKIKILFPGVICPCPWAIYMYKMESLNVLLWNRLRNFYRFHIGPSIERIFIICSNGSVPLNKMAAMPIYGKKKKPTKNHLLQNQESFEAESWYIARGHKVYQICSNVDHRLTFDLFTARSSFAPIH